VAFELTDREDIDSTAIPESPQRLIDDLKRRRTHSQPEESEVWLPAGLLVPTHSLGSPAALVPPKAASVRFA
jgi:hypothetical protein